MSADYLSWGRVARPAHVVGRPAFAQDAGPMLASLGPSVLPYGMGRSYGDSCLNGGGALLDTRSLDRWIAFDPDAGVIEVEAGVTLAAILAQLTAIASDWFLPVSPGTKYVTVGGAIANDVHGKNHHTAGCFGNHVRSLRLLRSDRGVLTCSPTENAGLFAATIGGMGLTGLVLSAEIGLKRVPSFWLDVEEQRYDDLDGFWRHSDASADWEYTVAWVDCLARGASLGRGVFTRARHADRPGAPPPPVAASRDMPADVPAFALNGISMAAFNGLYWRRAPRLPTRRVRSYEPVFYPLDAIGRWNRIYGRPGFHQYQCVIPPAAAAVAIPALLTAIAASRQGSFLAILKTLGPIVSPGMMSFPREGTTLALDFPNRGTATYDLLNRLDAITAEAGGRIYPAKDGRVSARNFQRGYPAWQDFSRHVDPRFSSDFWRRVSA